MSSPNSVFRYVGPFAVVVIAALLFGNALHPYWVKAFVDGRSSTSASGWLSPSWLALTWGYDLLQAFLAAIVLTLILPRQHQSAWIILMGVVIAGLRLLAVHDFPSPDADFTMYGWIYGGYLMPVVGAAIGAVVVYHFHLLRDQKQ